jgi:hypothetical protein
VAATFSGVSDWHYTAPPEVTLVGTDYYYAATNDLANVGSPTLGGAVYSGTDPDPWGGNSVNLNDGIYCWRNPSSGGYPDGWDSSTACIPPIGATYTIAFTNGMDITNVVVYSSCAANPDGRAKQNWKLEYRLAGETEYHFLIFSLPQDQVWNRSGQFFNKVIVTLDTNELYNVDSLRFTFLRPETNAVDQCDPTDVTYYREIEVFGTPNTVPTPPVTLSGVSDWHYSVPAGVILEGTFFYAATNDLANAGQPTLAGTTYDGPAGWDSSYPTLNDGIYAPRAGSDPNFYPDCWNSTTCLIVTEFNHNYTINFTGGMDLTNIVVWAGSGGATRAKQAWRLDYRVAGETAYRVLIGNLPQDTGFNRSFVFYNKVVVDLGSGLLNVDSLLFKFIQPVFDPDIDTGVPDMTYYREIDVFGAPSTGTPPTLGIVVSNSVSYVYWPATSDPGFVLEKNSDLTSPTTWVNAGTPFVEGGNNVVTNSLTSGPLFFRLKK